jgi:hypothetical protein
VTFFTFTGIKLQVKHADHLFRLYVKSRGKDTLFRVEEAKYTSNKKSPVEFVNDVFNPEQRLEKRLEAMEQRINQRLDSIIPKCSCNHIYNGVDKEVTDEPLGKALRERLSLKKRSWLMPSTNDITNANKDTSSPPSQNVQELQAKIEKLRDTILNFSKIEKQTHRSVRQQLLEIIEDAKRLKIDVVELRRMLNEGFCGRGPRARMISESYLRRLLPPEYKNAYSICSLLLLQKAIINFLASGLLPY